MSLMVVGCNHRTAPVQLRERLDFSGEKAVQALERLGAAHPEAEVVILSTCNRSEVYVACLADEPQAEWVIELMAPAGGMDRAGLELHLYTYEDAEAVEHLFRVAGGLDSMVLGEVQILGQVKQAYTLAVEQGTTGPLLNSLFQRALSVGKTVHAGTQIGRSRVSISSLAVDFARRIFDRFDDKTVLLVGAGKIGALTMTHLKEFAPGRVLVTNRRPDKARALAEQFQGEAVPFDRIADGLAEADVVISCTASEEPIVSSEAFEPILQRRRGRSMFIIDIAVPRDFDGAIGGFDNVYLYNIDDLEKVRQENLQRRQREVDRCLEIVSHETRAFLDEMATRETGPVISLLADQWTRIREAELERLLNKLDGVSPQERQQIAYTLHRLQRKFMHAPVQAMKQEVTGGTGHPFLNAVRRLLGMSE